MVLLPTERSKKRRWETNPTMSTPVIEIQFDAVAMEYTVVATTSRNEIQSVTVIDAVKTNGEFGVWSYEPARQLARTQSRKADLRPLSPLKRNRSSALEDHRNPTFLLERTSSFEDYRSSASSDHRQTLDSAARDPPSNERISLRSLRALSPIPYLMERKRSLPPRAPPPSRSFGAGLLFQRSISLSTGIKQSDGCHHVPSRRQRSNSRNQISERLTL